MLLNSRRNIRSAVNPLDKSTVVSIFPKDMTITKPTLFPGTWIIPAGTVEKPSTLVVGPSSWWKEVDEQQPMIEVTHGSIQIAKSIVEDYCNGFFCCNMTTSKPGLFWLPGPKFDLKDPEHKALFEDAKIKQNTYYRELVKMADGLWSRTNGNPLVIDDTMRMACRALGLEEQKDWMKDFTMMTSRAKCVACGSMRDPQYPVCPTCGHIDESRAKELGIDVTKFIKK